ncbi:MAG TPA: sigma-70 family RNA polymerase sigma factor [Candidatus Brocadiia bacterium]|nr:sigma-70 family RNA polymerase sigma factor [Candidatus Brocadiia bacterium]
MTAAPDEDDLWVRECRDGEVAAFDRLTLKYQDRVYTLAYRLTGNPEDALDVAQEAFLKAFRSLSGFHGASRFYTWIYRIVVNTAISWRRSGASRPRPLSLGDGDEGAAAVESAEPDPVESAQNAEETRLVEEAIAGLDAEHRAILVLRDVEGKNYDEIACILDCPRGTVKSRLHRARRLLRDALAPRLLADEDGGKARAERRSAD